MKATQHADGVVHPSNTVESPADIQVLVPSFKKFWWFIFLTIIYSMLAAVFEGLSIGLLIPFLQGMESESGKAFQTGISWIDTYLLAVDGTQLERLYRICGLILIATWARSIFAYGAAATGVEGRALIVEDLRMRIVDQLLSVSMRFYARVKTGEMINSLTNELVRVGQALQVVITYIGKGFLLVVYIVFMLWASWKLTLLVSFFFLILSFALTKLITSIRNRGKAITMSSANFMSLATEVLNGIRTVTTFNTQDYERRRLEIAMHRFAQAVIKTGKRSNLVMPLSQAAVTTVLVLVVLLAVQFFVLEGTFDLPILLAFLFALIRLMPVVQTINQSRGLWAGLRSALHSISRLIATDDKPYLEDGDTEFKGIFKNIQFENVSFAYEEDELVLSDVHLELEAGKITALVGASGAGKSTLVDLIPRLYDPTAGRILIDGVDIRSLQIGTLRNKIAVVSQDTFIFNASVAANITYGLKDVPMERIEEAARRASADEFIESLPEKYETVLGDRGTRLSGGQRQRIAIARAILRDPEILILDEATSALDSMTEQRVQESLGQLLQNRTVVAIAHRLSTIENADKVVVLENGRVVESGTYEELLDIKGHLWEYHSIQFQQR